MPLPALPRSELRTAVCAFLMDMLYMGSECSLFPTLGPTQVHLLGPPVPPCEDQRLATIRALDKMSKPVPEVRS